MCALQDASLPTFVIEHPWAVWLVGPMFAALAGVSFKEVNAMLQLLGFADA